MTDFSIPQKKYMDELFLKLTNTFTDKIAKINSDLQREIINLKEEIQVVNIAHENKLKKLEETNKSLHNNIIQLQRKVRKNNLVIFGIPNTEISLLSSVTKIINEQLEIEFDESDINDSYRIGPKKNTQRPVIVELLSYKKKQQILRNSKKLKGKNISIAHDLCFEDRCDQKILTKHLKEAKSKGYQAYLKGNKLLIGDEIYTAEELENGADYQELIQKADSAPSTPNPENRQKRLLCEFGLEEEQRQHTEKTPIKPVNNKTDKKTNIYKTRSNSSSNSQK